jgi:hypothetical protein
LFPLFGKGNRLYIQKAFASIRQLFGFIYSQTPPLYNN